MSDAASARIRILLAAPGYAGLLAGVRARVEAGGDAARTVTFEELDPEQRDALAGLLDRPAERRSARGERERMWAGALEVCRGEGREELCRLLDRLRASGGLARAVGAAGLEPSALLGAASAWNPELAAAIHEMESRALCRRAA